MATRLLIRRRFDISLSFEISARFEMSAFRVGIDRRVRRPFQADEQASHRLGFLHTFFILTMSQPATHGQDLPSLLRSIVEMGWKTLYAQNTLLSNCGKHFALCLRTF